MPATQNISFCLMKLILVHLIENLIRFFWIKLFIFATVRRMPQWRIQGARGQLYPQWKKERKQMREKKEDGRSFLFPPSKKFLFAFVPPEKSQIRPWNAAAPTNQSTIVLRISIIFIQGSYRIFSIRNGRIAHREDVRLCL